MKKIMFNDKYGLTQAVLDGRKTMTRRIACKEIQQLMNASEKSILMIPVDAIPESVSINQLVEDWAKIIYKEKCEEIKPSVTKEDVSAIAIAHSPYKIGEVVAIAQSYKDAGYDEDIKVRCKGQWHTIGFTAGWENKMFVRADEMPHRIKITNIKIERLQDINEEDIYREGFENQSVNNGWGNAAWHWETMLTYMDDLGRYKEIRSREPKEAFACLIDKVSGYGTWEKNPWVFAYEFELIK